MDIVKRNREIREDYLTMTLEELSSKYNLSLTQLCRITAGIDKSYAHPCNSAEWLESKLAAGYTKRQMALEAGVPISSIAYWIRKLRNKIKSYKTVKESTSWEDSAEWFKTEYEIKKHGIPTIATKIGKSVGFVAMKLKEYGINRRNLKDAMSLHHKRPSKEWLDQRYNIEKKSIQACADDFGVTFETIFEALREYDFVIRSASDQHSGELNEFYGCQHTPETVEYCRNIGMKYGREYWITGDVENKIEQVRAKAKEIWSDPNKRIEQSRRITQLCMNGGCNSKQLLYIRSRDEKSFLFRSSWEYAVALIFESCDLISDWDYETLSIPIIQDDGIKNYLVDFEIKWVDGTTTYVECKNKHLLSKDSEKQKIIQAAEFLRKQRSNLIIVDDIDDINNWLSKIPPTYFKWVSDNRYYSTVDYLNEPQLVQEILRHYITNKLVGWTPPKYNIDELRLDWDRVRFEKLDGYNCLDSIKSTVSNSRGMPGRALIMGFQPHFLEVQIGKSLPLAMAFNDSWIIYRSLLQSMEERESLSYERLLREINFHFTKYSRTSHFAPGFARSIIRMFNACGKRIFDPCCGWGGRMIAAFVEGCEYSGCELSPNTFHGLSMISDFIGCEFNVQNKSCLDILWPESDLIFTSPPFFDVEKYIGGEQPWMINDRNKWIDEFVFPFVHKINSKCVLYLDERTKNDFELVRKFDNIIRIKNKRHPRQKDGFELLCVYD